MCHFVWIAKKLCVDIYAPLRMNCNRFGDPWLFIQGHNQVTILIQDQLPSNRAVLAIRHTWKNPVGCRLWVTGLSRKKSIKFLPALCVCLPAPSVCLSCGVSLRARCMSAPGLDSLAFHSVLQRSCSTLVDFEQPEIKVDSHKNNKIKTTVLVYTVNRICGSGAVWIKSDCTKRFSQVVLGFTIVFTAHVWYSEILEYYIVWSHAQLNLFNCLHPRR